MKTCFQQVVAKVPRRIRHSGGYTIVELLVATVVSLMLMMLVVSIIGTAGTGIATSRAALEMSDRLRETQARLAQDLQGLTVTMSPPRNPASNEGYFEYLEGPVGVVQLVMSDPLLDASKTDTGEPNFPVVAVNAETEALDTTVGDNDDVLMFTTHSKSAPFVGRYGGTGTAQSSDAEVAWFLRGRTLYRRVLLVAPSLSLAAPTGFFANNDISVRNEGGTLVGNTLGDLTKRENRFAHRGSYPFDVRVWGHLRLPTLAECSDVNWVAGATAPTTATPFSVRTAISPVDFWFNPHPWASLPTGSEIVWPGTPVSLPDGRMSDYDDGARIGEDVILTNVVGFDVKVWDPNAPIFKYTGGTNNPALLPGDPGYLAALAAYAPPVPGTDPQIIGYGAYVDLNYTRNIAPALSAFAGPGVSMPVAGGRALNAGLGWTYDTWSTHYENDGIDEDGDGLFDEGTNAFDDDTSPSPGYGIVDDAGEQETSPPYPIQIRGIQVKIRVFEPDSRQIREVTVVEKF